MSILVKVSKHFEFLLLVGGFCGDYLERNKPLQVLVKGEPNRRESSIPQAYEVCDIFYHLMCLRDGLGESASCIFFDILNIFQHGN